MSRKVPYWKPDDQDFANDKGCLNKKAVLITVIRGFRDFRIANYNAQLCHSRIIYNIQCAGYNALHDCAKKFLCSRRLIAEYVTRVSSAFNDSRFNYNFIFKIKLYCNEGECRGNVCESVCMNDWRKESI